MRVLVPCCPDAIYYFRDAIYLIGILAVTYTALVTLAQTDLKRIIAYSSVGHMNLSVLGLFTLSIQGIEGSVFSMISHGFISSGLFICVGVLYDRYGTKLIGYYGSLASLMPTFAAAFFFLTFANLAFPGTSAFVGEFLTFLGLVSTNMLLFLISSLSVIFVAIYSVWTYNRVAFGPNTGIASLRSFSDLTSEELFTLAFLIAPVLLFGLFPDPILRTLHVSVLSLLH
jgi:NADH:ubiquinone oxidoreductase subunit 4 (subunit M)